MSLTVNSLDVIEFILGTKNVAILYDDVLVAESMSLKRGYLSTVFLCLLQRPYEIQALEPTALIFLHCSTLKTPNDHEHFTVNYDNNNNIIIRSLVLTKDPSFLAQNKFRRDRNKS